MTKTMTAGQVLGIRHDDMTLTGMWGECVGTMPRHGVVFIWGNSGNGKSTAALSLCRELTRFGRVLYVSLEEGYAMSLQNAIRRTGLAEVGARFQVLDRATVGELDERLSKRRSAEFVAIDSFQYLGMSYRQYVEFRRRHGNKLLIFISHADGRQPKGRAARSVIYDADLKIWVEGHTAFSKGRFIGSTGRAVLWEKGAEEYFGEKPIKDRNNGEED